MEFSTHIPNDDAGCWLRNKMGITTFEEFRSYSSAQMKELLKLCPASHHFAMKNYWAYAMLLEDDGNNEHSSKEDSSTSTVRVFKHQDIECIRSFVRSISPNAKVYLAGYNNESIDNPICNTVLIAMSDNEPSANWKTSLQVLFPHLQFRWKLITKSSQVALPDDREAIARLRSTQPTLLLPQILRDSHVQKLMNREDVVAIATSATIDESTSMPVPQLRVFVIDADTYESIFGKIPNELILSNGNTIRVQLVEGWFLWH